MERKWYVCAVCKEVYSPARSDQKWNQRGLCDDCADAENAKEAPQKRYKRGFREGRNQTGLCWLQSDASDPEFMRGYRAGKERAAYEHGLAEEYYAVQ